jgi:pentatricopeptide repeat protein
LYVLHFIEYKPCPFFATLSESTFGALLHSYGVANQFENAATLLKSMESGDLGVKPDSSCYDAFIMTCLKRGDYDEVLNVFEKMKSAQISPSPAASHGILLAACRLGDCLKAIEAVKELLLASASFGSESTLLVFRLLMPNYYDGIQTVADMRRNLRTLSLQADPQTQHRVLRINRFLRVAELEDTRRSSVASKFDELQERRMVSWRNVVTEIVRYSDEVEGRNASDCNRE